MAEVWQAKEGDACVALKFFEPGKELDPVVLQLLATEFLSMTIKHPNVLMPQGAAMHNDMPYLRMPYMSRGSLRAYLRTRTAHKRIGEDQLVRVLGQMAAAVSFLHKNSFVHQDIAPENILFTDSGHLVLTDFGISRILHNMLGHDLGPNRIFHPAYASPERFVATSATSADDIFSIGAIIYEMCTGRPPWGDDGGAALLEDETAPSVPGEYSDDLIGIVESCLSLRPESRPVAADLERWAEEYPQRMRALQTKSHGAVHGSEHTRARAGRQAEQAQKPRTTSVAASEAVATGAAQTARENHTPAMEHGTRENASARVEQEEAARLAREADDRKSVIDSVRKAREEAELRLRQDLELQLKSEFNDRLQAVLSEVHTHVEKRVGEAERSAREAMARAERAENEMRAREANERRMRSEQQRQARDASVRNAALEAERRAREESEKVRRAEAERKARELSAKHTREEADRVARAEAEKQRRAEAERLAREEAERQAHAETERRRNEEKIRAEREAAVKQARVQEEERARAEAEKWAREEAERRRRLDEEHAARVQAERRARESEEKLERERELARVREDAEHRARAEAERTLREELEQSLLPVLQERARTEERAKAREEYEQRLREREEQWLREKTDILLRARQERAARDAESLRVMSELERRVAEAVALVFREETERVLLALQKHETEASDDVRRMVETRPVPPLLSESRPSA
ncbi:MAG: protein kinase [Ignavibacteriae bacterium]|nr:protein kinase [Ignavibacteriota bacterium]